MAVLIAPNSDMDLSRLADGRRTGSRRDDAGAVPGLPRRPAHLRRRTPRRTGRIGRALPAARRDGRGPSPAAPAAPLWPAACLLSFADGMALRRSNGPSPIGWR